jgi:hypothetical protein
MTPRVPFTAEPVLGTRMIIDGQGYALVGKFPYDRRDGSVGVMLRWRTACPVCGTEFETNAAFGGSSPTRRCREHRALSRQVTRGPRHRRLNITIIDPEVAA